MAYIKAVFKRGTKSLKENYRPISEYLTFGFGKFWENYLQAINNFFG